MNELEICVVTKHHDSNSIIGEGVQGRQWKQRVIVDVYGKGGTCEYRMQKEEEADPDRFSDDDFLSDEEENDPFEMEGVPGGSRGPCAVPQGTDPIRIPSPVHQNPHSPLYSTMTPSYFFPFGSMDPISPLSSGYGSAPRFFNSIGTQTPPTTPVLLTETYIRLRPMRTHGGDASGERGLVAGRPRTRRRLFQEANGRTRFYSEGSGSEAVAGAEDQNLPDVISFRGRANSAPSRPITPQVQAGRALRRISDEFESLYIGSRERNIIDRLRNYFTHPRVNQNEERRADNGSSV